MLKITFKNILKNKVLSLCLVVGFIFTIAVICAVPMFSESVLNNYIQNIFKSAENKIEINNLNNDYTYSAALKITKNFNYNVDFNSLFEDYKNAKKSFFAEDKKLGLSIVAEKATLTLDNITYAYNKGENESFSSKNQIEYISDINKHINFIKGEMGTNILSKNNEVEVITDESTFNNFNLELNKSYEVTNINKAKPLRLKVVGVFDIKDKKEGFWLDKGTNFYCKFIVTEGAFANLLKNNEEYTRLFNNIGLEAIYDVKSINTSNAKLAYDYGKILSDTFTARTGSRVLCTVSDNLKDYVDKEGLYKTVMWIFLIPVLIVVLYYIWMISCFVVEADKEQIAVLKSRGASKLEIIRIYLNEGLVLSSIGFLAGPILSIILCKVISYSDGFLVFSKDQEINISFTYKIYILAAVAVIVLLGILLLSVHFASEKSIVDVKRNNNRYVKFIFSNKYMDFILLIISVYGYYNYAINKNVLILGEVNKAKAPLDPLLYLTSSVFIIGAGMFLLRLYRYIAKLCFKIGKNNYFTTLYIAIINLLRYHLKNSIALLFVVITVAIGIFNLHIAKDINTSYINTVKYTTGADFILTGKWEKLANTNGEIEVDKNANLYSYIEPSYSQYSKVEGIEKFTRVANISGGRIGLASNGGMGADIMGIIPNEFGQIAYFDSQLLTTHWFNYLNAMTNRKDIVIISKGLSDVSGIKVGDTVYYSINQGLNIQSTVYAVVDYWPGYSNLQNKSLLICNFNYLFSRSPIYPYEIWMKKKPNISDDVIYSSIRNEKLQITEFKNLNIENYYAKNDIFLKGTNSILNLGFLSIGAIAILGFIIYWIISLKTRKLSFGIYRSLGISSKEISKTLLIEQFLTLGVSILIGIGVGNITSWLFIPLVKELWYKNRYVIPVKNLSYLYEYLQFSVILLVIFIISFIILKIYISKLKMHQAIKLGDD
ncbi:ABC transporter permease [Candidatus Clostridium stratigraminis]|uniref:FtsX-like permease family protein n=1 Tax=Candidatus Clostridium stratigraminis TaxID=3381661 RepID=A0ABW8TA77_9CLOT